MIGSAPSDHRPAGRLFALLVLAVLAGVLGMHALAPGGTAGAAHPAGTPHGSHHAQAVASCPESGHDGDRHRHHLGHADDVCAAAGVASPYVPPPPAAALTGLSDTAPVTTAVPASAVTGRAPPDLAELQLLRI